MMRDKLGAARVRLRITALREEWKDLGFFARLWRRREFEGRFEVLHAELQQCEIRRIIGF